MPFMVIYRTSDGRSSFEQADAIDEAALFVERLRNSDGIDEIRIYRMEEIGFAFRPYYKVELGLPDRQTQAPPPEIMGGMTVVEEPVAPPPVAAPAPTNKLTKRVVGAPEAPLELDDPLVARPVVAAAVPPPPSADALVEGAGANGARRGLFGR